MSEEIHYSALFPGGIEASLIAKLFWVLLVAAIVIWIIFLCLQFSALRGRPSERWGRRASQLFVGGGILLPSILITISIIYTLRPLPELLRRHPSSALTVHVSGLQWWWRIRYEVDGKIIETANEIRLPVNRPVNFILTSEDVIHSFWVPSLAGKMDMIPGRENYLGITPIRKGTYIGHCAEFCGASHALMRLEVKVVEEEEFQSWLKKLEAPHEISNHPGEKSFLASGCASCHSVRGLTETGVIGPDLSRLGLRRSIGAGIIPNDFHNMKKWITRPGMIKPEVKMPAFESLPEKEREDIAEWLGSLR